MFIAGVPSVVIAALMLFASSNATCACSHRVSVLSTFYTATHGEAWTTRAGGTIVDGVVQRPLERWDVTDPSFPCSLNDSSVVCDITRKDITVISLARRGLNGTIPFSLGDLTELEVLELSENRLKGVLPDSLKHCRKMRVFNVSTSNITGTLPSSYAAWFNLTIFNVVSSSLSGTLPPEYGNNPNWSTSLVMFSVYTNLLTGTLPPEYGNWSNLEFFTVALNSLSGTLPASLGNWRKVYRVSLFVNNFSGSLPKEYSQWRNIGAFNARDNQLTGTIPQEYADWSTSSGPFTSFYVTNNKLHGTLPEALHLLTRLQFFVVGGNDALGGTLPILYRHWNVLHEFDASRCNFSGTLPPMFNEFGPLMTVFSVESNSLIGTLPASYSSWASLMTLNVEGNGFTGTIPASYGQQMKVLVTFRAGRNQLVGSIPSELVQLDLLTFFSLGFNRLSGSLPAKSTRSLQLFDVQNNTQLTGSLPPQLSALVTTCATEIACPTSILFKYCFPGDFISSLDNSIHPLDVVNKASKFIWPCSADASSTRAPIATSVVEQNNNDTSTHTVSSSARVVVKVTSALLQYASLGAVGGTVTQKSIPALQRAMAVMRLRALCSASASTGASSSKEPSLFSELADNPLAFAFGVGTNQLNNNSGPEFSPSLDYAAGAAVGNMLLVPAIAVVFHALHMIKSKLVFSSESPTKCEKHRTEETAQCAELPQSLVRALPSSMLPGSISIGYPVLLQPAIGASTALLVSVLRDSRSIVCGLVVMLAWLSFPLFCAYRVMCIGRRTEDGRFQLCSEDTCVKQPRRIALSKSEKQQQRFVKLQRTLRLWYGNVCSVRQLLLEPTQMWGKRNNANFRKKKMINYKAMHHTNVNADFLLHNLEEVIGGYVEGREWYFLVEWSIGALSGGVFGAAAAIIDGTNTNEEDGCQAATWGTWSVIVLVALEIVLALLLKPFSVRLDLVGVVFVGTLALISEVITLAQPGDDDGSASTVATLASVVALVMLMISIVNVTQLKWTLLFSPRADNATTSSQRMFDLDDGPHNRTAMQRSKVAISATTNDAPKSAAHDDEFVTSLKSLTQRDQLERLIVMACRVRATAVR